MNARAATARDRLAFASRGAAAAATAALLALCTLLPITSDAALVISANVSINWIPVDPILPTDIFTGDSVFTSGVFVNQVFVADHSFGATHIPGDPTSPSAPIDIFIPVEPTLPGESIVWRFGGLIQHGLSNFDTFAFPPGTSIPPDPLTPPLITVAFQLAPGFAPIDLSGPIYAFDDPIRVGTWDVRIAQVPEPATLALVCLGLGGLGLSRRKHNANAKPTSPGA